MKKQVNPVMVVVAIIIALVVLGLLGTKVINGGEAQQVVVKPANPNDTKYQPDPKLKLENTGT